MSAQVIVRNTPWGTGNYRTDEKLASGTITPGDLIEFGGANEVQVHATAGGNAQPLFAIEGFAGQGIDDTYILGQDVQFVRAGAGWQIQARLAVGENVAEGAALESAGDGTLQAHVRQQVNEGGAAVVDIDTRPIVAYAGEDLDNSAGGAAARLNVEVA